jgi:TRAP-type mannitol/chloroaromatic compound transport system substrate-binding protein
VELARRERLQSIVHNAARSATTLMLAKYDANNGPALQRLIAGGTEVRASRPRCSTTSSASPDEVNAEKAAADPFYARAFASFQAFQASVVDWHATSEGGLAPVRVRRLSERATAD